MATHMAAFQQSVDAATNTAINTVVDDILTRTGADRFLVPTDYNFLRWAIAAGPNITRAFIDTPSLDVRRMRADVIPHRRGSELLSLGSPELWIPPSPIELVPTEELQAFITEDAAGASQLDVVVALGPADLPAPPSGDMRLIRLTGTTTLVARAWTTCLMTPEQTLEPGTYHLLGFYPISANVLAARVLIVGQNNRPGCPGLAGTEGAARDFEAALLPQTMFYDMGEFTHLTIPQWQYFASVADTAETVLAWVVKTG